MYNPQNNEYADKIEAAAEALYDYYYEFLNTSPTWEKQKDENLKESLREQARVVFDTFNS